MMLVTHKYIPYFMWRTLWLALPLALGLFLLFPGTSKAHAIFLKSSPVRGAVLLTAPSQVRLWFSEDLNPATSTAVVLNATHQRIDINGSMFPTNDAREMDVALTSLPPGRYVVVWRTQSADDGNVLTGSFAFYVARPDGSVTTLNGPLPDQNILGSMPDASNQLGGPNLLSLLMITLLDLGVVFWVGAQLWHAFMLDSTMDETTEQRAFEQAAKQRFEQHFSFPILGALFLANIGVLLGQTLTITGGRWDQIFAPAQLSGLISGHFGTFWIAREIVIVLAMLLNSYATMTNKRSRQAERAISWGNLILSLALLLAITLSGPASAVSGTTGIFAILVDWLHVLAAALWVGGLFYIALIYMPILYNQAPEQRTRALLTMLTRFSPFVIAGIVIMVLSGPFDATMHMTSFAQLTATAYGRTLIIKVVCVCALLIASAIHMLNWRPQLRQDYQAYQESQQVLAEEKEPGEAEALEVKELAQSISKQANRLTALLGWEALLGVVMLLCTGLLSVFAGTLVPLSVSQFAPSHQPFTTTMQTSDKQFTIKLDVTPDRIGPDTFTATVLDKSGKADANVNISLTTDMLDMNMGTNTLTLQPDGKGHFTGTRELSMAGNWSARIVVRTPDNRLHESSVKFVAKSFDTP